VIFWSENIPSGNPDANAAATPVTNFESRDSFGSNFFWRYDFLSKSEMPQPQNVDTQIVDLGMYMYS
jgi:hypothetical protein